MFGISTPEGDEVLAILLQQPSFVREQQAVLQLLQASKAVRAAVAAHCGNSLQLSVCRGRNALQQFVQFWLPQHAGLLQQLELQQATHRHGIDWTAAARQALSSAQLQSFALSGTYVTANILQILPAAHLTQLSYVTHNPTHRNMAAAAGLTALRSLQITFNEQDTRTQDSKALAHLAAGLQQLTQLRIGPISPRGLQYVPPNVAQLHATLGFDGKPQMLRQLAGWIKQRGSIVRSMVWIEASPRGYSPTAMQQWRAALQEVADALAAAAKAAPAAGDTAARGHSAALVAAAGAGEEVTRSSSAAAAAATAVGTCTRRQLQLLSFSVPLAESYGCSSITTVLQQLPASTLMQLQCSIDWSSSADVAALCQLTALRRVHVVNDRAMPDAALASLSSLRQLVSLQLQSVKPAHLQELPPWLQQLDVAHINPAVTSRQQQVLRLQLGHLTGMTALRLGARPSYSQGGYESARHCDIITAESQLPPNLQELSWPDCSSTEPLLHLQQLQRLQLHRIEQQLDAAQLLQLCDISSLTELQLGYGRAESIAASAAATWQRLPSLRALSLYCSSGDACPTARSVQADVVQQVRSLQGLTRLEIANQHIDKFPSLVNVTPAQLGAALLPLTALQQLRIEGICLALPPLKRNSSFTWCQPPEGVMELLDAVGALEPGLQKLRIKLDMSILKEDVGRICSQQQRLQRQLVVFNVQLDELVLAKGCFKAWDE
jgi:hypothetical protein